jgi:uncharacterized protein (DUF58 family)
MDKHPSTSFILDRQHIYILPTRHGLLFALVLLVMLLGSMNYNNSLGYSLTFLLGSLAVVSILHTYRNLVGLAVRAGRSPPVFAGQEARFEVYLDNRGGRERRAIGVQKAEHPSAIVDITAGGQLSTTVTVPTERRGRLPLGRLRLFTYFPLGLFRAWANVILDLTCIVYPRPDAPAPMPSPISEKNQGEGIQFGKGSEDFSGLRNYSPTDSPRHVAWKAVARSQVLVTKQFTGQASAKLWFDWDALADMDPEARLSRLCRWVLDAHAAGYTYGLRLPGGGVAPNTGDEHMRQCLEALALYKRAR